MFVSKRLDHIELPKLFYLCLVSVLLSVACVPAMPVNVPPTSQVVSATSTPTATQLPPTPISTPQPTDTPTPTFTPQSTETLSSTSTPTSAPTATVKPAQTRPANTPRPTDTPIVAAKVMQPGLYTQNRCVTANIEGISGSGKEERHGDQPSLMCVMSVESLADGSFKVNVSWSLEGIRRVWRYVALNTNGEFTNSYLIDNRGNRYTAIDLSGAARDPTPLGEKGLTAIGWYIFPAPQAGATSFALRDDEQQINIDGIVIK